MTCRRCLHLITSTEDVHVATYADQLFDRTPRGGAVHADRAVCIANLRPYHNSNRKEVSHDAQAPRSHGRRVKALNV